MTPKEPNIPSDAQGSPLEGSYPPDDYVPQTSGKLSVFLFLLLPFLPLIWVHNWVYDKLIYDKHIDEADCFHDDDL